MSATLGSSRDPKAALALFFVGSLPFLLAFHLVVRVRGAWCWLHAGRWRLFAFRALASLTALALGAAGMVVRHVYADRSGLPDLAPFLRFEPPTIGQVYGADGDVVVELAREYRRILRYQDLPPIVSQAILAGEDRNFFQHDGVDYWVFPRVLFKAVVHSLAASVQATRLNGAPTGVVVFPQGGSTVTQQLVRIYFLPEMIRGENGDSLLLATFTNRLLASIAGLQNANKLTRKVEEIRLALWLERNLASRLGSKRRAKQEILARYASFAYLGNGRYGVAAASEYYFGVPIAAYTREDADKAALLAGIAKSPADYAPSETNLERPRNRRNEVLGLMAAGGYLAPEVAKQLQQRPIVLAARRPVKTIAPAAVATVFEEIKRRPGGQISIESLIQGRINVHSTVSTRLQRVVNEALENGLRSYEARHPEGKGVIQGAALVLANRDARILAVVGGRGFYNMRSVSYSDLNRATSCRRQPGSAWKPFVYLAAFQHGSSLDTRVDDAPVRVPMGRNRPAKWISNYDEKFKGVIPVRQALAESRNAATMSIVQRVGIDQVLETARLLGIHSRIEPYPTTALGASEVTLLELANAYRSIATGTLAEPHVIERITDAEGGVVFAADPRVRTLPIPAAALEQIQEGLRSVVRLPGATGHSLDDGRLRVPVMGKTGTTNDFRDALFVGSTYGPDGVTAAVWVGYDDNRPLGDEETGARAALPIFREIVLRAYEDKLVGSVPRFPRKIESGIDAYLERCHQPELVAGMTPATSTQGQGSQ